LAFHHVFARLAVIDIELVRAVYLQWPPVQEPYKIGKDPLVGGEFGHAGAAPFRTGKEALGHDGDLRISLDHPVFPHFGECPESLSGDRRPREVLWDLHGLGIHSAIPQRELRLMTVIGLSAITAGRFKLRSITAMMARTAGLSAYRPSCPIIEARAG